MAQKIDFHLPFNDLTQYVPSNLRNSVVTGLLDNLFNRFLTRDESAPLYGYAGNTPSNAEDKTPRIPQLSVERDINAITPVLNFKIGTERFCFTVNDLISKAERVGINTSSQNWLYSQGNNFCPPITFDKFVNFFNYYWVAKAVSSTPQMEWNAEKLPEYFVIERPSLTDRIKLNCRTASNPGQQFVTTGSGFLDQIWAIQFTSPLTFTITPSTVLVGPQGLYTQVAAEQSTYVLSALSTGLSNPVDVSQTFSFTVQGPAGTFTLLQFKITRTPTFNENNQHDGYTEFSAGDKIELNAKYLSSTWSFTFTGTPGLKPIIGSVRTHNEYQTIGGVQLTAGDRVLLRSPGVLPNGQSSVSGIFEVKPGVWVSPDDFNQDTWLAGAETFITEGINSGKLFRSSAVSAPALWSWTQVGTESNTNDWQEGNFWITSEEVERLGLDKSLVLQATRPIIEYSSNIQLNARVQDGRPVDSDTAGTSAPAPNYRQKKTVFNQLPLFDLFRYDGTHSNLVSSIFYYEEDSTAPLDTALQRRVKRAENGSADFIFNHGCVDLNGHLLFYRTGRSDEDLHTVWKAGYTEATVVDITNRVNLIELPGSVTFSGSGNGTIASIVGRGIEPQTITISFTSATTFSIVGSLEGYIGDGMVNVQFVSDKLVLTVVTGTISFSAGSQFDISLVYPGQITGVSATDTTQQQIWTLTFNQAGTFMVSGSKNVYLPEPFNTAAVNAPYDNGEIAFTITSTLPFSVGDQFIIRVANLERPRYVFRDDSNSITDKFGGPALDSTGEGAYQASRTFINNPHTENRAELPEGIVYSHFRSIISNQIKGQSDDYAFGGQIKLWSEQHSLLASLLMQRDLTPISMIDLAKRLYEGALNSVREIYIQNIVEYFSTQKVASVAGSSADTSQDKQEVSALLDYILDIRSVDQEVRQVLFDTSSGVVGFPATLPQLGICELVEPFRAFDKVLGRDVLIHHDGHVSIPFADTQEFRQVILGNYASKTVQRSDGTSTPAVGSFTATPPENPYKGELWLLPSGEMRAFDVDFDTVSTPSAEVVGSRWYNRNSRLLFVSNGVTWDLGSDPSTAWKTVNLAETLNEIFMQVEQRLYDHINPNQRKFDFSVIHQNSQYQDQLRRELFTFAAREGLDPLATNYNPQDAFTWNYSQAVLTSFAAVSTPSVPARWYNALIAHQQTVPGVIPTERPNLEPWKLLGFSSYSSWWSALSASQRTAFESGVAEDDLDNFVYQGSVRVVAASTVTNLSGLKVIDGVQLSAGDRVLLTAETSTLNNGVWVVSLGGWARSLDPLPNRWFEVTDGVTRRGTRWAVTSAGIANLNPVIVKQARIWSDALWQHVQLQRPSLKVSINIYTDDLLPPYVSLSSSVSQFALTNALPSGITQPFQFGEGSPVEEIWERSIEYGYAQAKALFRFDPLAFLGFCWGFNWVEADGILYDGVDISIPGNKRFKLHGESTNSSRSSASFNFTAISSPISASYTVTYDAYDSQRRQNFSVRRSDGSIAAFIQEGVTTSLTFDGITLSSNVPFIEDAGIPFRIGDMFNLTVTAPSTLSTSFSPAAFHSILGFGQIFTNALRSVSIDTSSSFAISAFRGWDVNMGHRAGGLVATDDLRVYTETDTLSRASYDLVFKKNDGVKDLWLQALRVVLIQKGTADISGEYPANTAEDWIFRIEGYNANYLDIDYYSLQSIDSGTQFPTSPALGQTFFRHDLGSAYVWNGSSWSLYAYNAQTFYALDESATALTWFKPLTKLTVETSRLPITIIGLQNVISFIFGYAMLMEEQGWMFDSSTETSLDLSTGRHRTWQLEVETLVDRVFRGMSLGQGHIVNPFVDRIQVRQDTGLLSQFSEAPLFDIYSHAAAFDIAGKKIKTDDLIVERTNQLSSVSSIVPIFSMHALIDEYEHLFVFNNFVDEANQTGSLYDVFSGGRVVTYKFNGRRQNTGTLRPEFGGHYLAGNEVKLNLQASTDALSNIYDANFAFENTLLSKHSLALLGFNNKKYFNDLDINDKSQFNFWRGLVQSKGTNLSIDAYLNNNRFKDARLDEYWAYKVAEYGDARQKTFPELKLQVNDTLQQFTLLQFDAPSFSSSDGELPGQLVNFSQISRFDESRWFSIEDLDQDTFFKAEPVGSISKQVLVGEIVNLPFIADATDISGVAHEKLNATTIKALAQGNISVVGYGPATPRYNPVKLFNFVDDALVEEIAFWHPAIGQQTPSAIEGINTISSINPARYNYSTLVVNNNSYDPLRPWGDREVGRIWFDTTNLSYIPYYDAKIFPSRAERLSRWGALADFASIDVYEWVKSSVPPSEYNARALTDAGNADISSSEKASGEVALEELYYRDREWFIRPVAWSFSPTPQDIDWGNKPPMKYSGDVVGEAGLTISGTKIILESGKFFDYDIAAGDKIGTWQYGDTPSPLSEGTLNDTFQLFLDGTTQQSASNFSLTVEPIGYPETRMYGTVFVEALPVSVTQIRDTDGAQTNQWDFSYSISISNEAGQTETVVAYVVRVADTNTDSTPPTEPSISVVPGQTFTYDFPLSGLRFTAVYNGSASSVQAGVISSSLQTAFDGQFACKDAVTVEWLIPAEDGRYTNDEEDPLFAFNQSIGWRVWAVPTQQQLNVDSRQPKSSWKAFIGSLMPFSPTYDQLQEAVAYQQSPLTLNNGVSIERYSPKWSEWKVLRNVRKTETAVETAPVTFNASDFSISKFDANKTAVYVNGISQLRSSFEISGSQLTINSVQSGSRVDVIVERYEPTQDELEFNPEVEDDYSVQRQYKKDYEYVQVQQRDRDGNLGTTYYYFWVKNKSTTSSAKKMSIQLIAQQLRDGPANYLTFQHILPPENGLPWRYDSITIAGLSYVVTKDNTFKLRFTRNFALRDDPNDLDLKNTHTEWRLMRPGQKNRIPERLWMKLIDSAAGIDGAGNELPSLRRQLYDERNGTTTRFGFGTEQILAPSNLLRTSLASAIVNTRLTVEVNDGNVPDFIQFIDSEISLLEISQMVDPVLKAMVVDLKVKQIERLYFSTPEVTRQTMTKIWSQASISQVNELFFAALEDILASNFELTDIFKTSRLSLYSIQEKSLNVVASNYE